MTHMTYLEAAVVGLMRGIEIFPGPASATTA